MCNLDSTWHCGPWQKEGISSRTWRCVHRLGAKIQWVSRFFSSLFLNRRNPCQYSGRTLTDTEGETHTDKEFIQSQTSPVWRTCLSELPSANWVVGRMRRADYAGHTGHNHLILNLIDSGFPFRAGGEVNCSILGFELDFWTNSRLFPSPWSVRKVSFDSRPEVSFCFKKAWSFNSENQSTDMQLKTAHPCVPHNTTSPNVGWFSFRQTFKSWNGDCSNPWSKCHTPVA